MRGYIVLVAVAIVATANAVSVDGGPRQGTTLPIFKAYQPTLPDDLLAALRRDALVQHKIVQSGSKLKFNKLATNWYPLAPGKTHTPRFAAEAAIHLLRDVDFDPADYAAQGIVGAEWWFQYKVEHDEDIGFHFDKDEAVASDEMRMVLPTLSTVTYLSDVGGPTLIFNQTTLNGNMNVPLIPESGALFFPEDNKHINFHGNLMHGVVGSLSELHNRAPASASSPRITFLVNWWSVTPKPPNCAPPSAATVKRHIATSGGIIGKALEPVAVQEVPLSLLTSTDAKDRWTTVVLPPEERVNFRLPVRFPTGSHRIEWPEDAILAGIHKLDLFEGPSVNLVFQTEEPKVICFYNTDVSPLADLEMVFGVAVKPFLADIVAFTAASKVTRDAMQTFGIEEDQLPVVAIHDTARDDKRVMPHSSGPLQAPAIAEFVRQYLATSTTKRMRHQEL